MEIANIESSLSKFQPISTPIALDERIIEMARERLTSIKTETRKTRLRPLYWAPVAIALVILLTSLLIPKSPIVRIEGPHKLAGKGFVISQDVPVTVYLRDKSKISMAPNTHLKTLGKKGGVGQVVYLERGEVLAQVPKERAAQFQLQTQVARVTTLGTKFKVKLGFEDEKGGRAMKKELLSGLVTAVMTVSVVEGRVKVENPYGKVIAKADQVVVAKEASKPTLLAFGALPETVRGFSGQVRGKVVEKSEKHSFAFKVFRVLRVWKNNRAGNPEALAGWIVRVGPRWKKSEDGKWHPVKLHVAFIRKLKAGQEITLEIHNVEREEFAILELSQEQREWAARRDEEEEVPATTSSLGKIEVGKPRYVSKEHKAWKERGRIVGITRNVSKFTTELRTPAGDVVVVKEWGECNAYELEWLDPGIYELRVRAKGYKPVELEGLEVKAGYDLRIDLEFSDIKR